MEHALPYRLFPARQNAEALPFCSFTQALAKLCVKWNCMNNSNNLHKP